MVAGAKEAKDGVDGGHAGRKHIGGEATLEFGHGPLESFTIGMIGPGVVVAALRFAEFLVDVSGSLIDGRDHRACGRIGFLANVNRIRRKSHSRFSLTACT